MEEIIYIGINSVAVFLVEIKSANFI